MLTSILKGFEMVSSALAHVLGWGPYVLVIVDMQPEFASERQSKLFSNVAGEIRRARRLGMPIVLVEYQPQSYGSTYRLLTALVDGYELLVTVRKRGMDGSRAVLKACKARGFATNRFRVCGVYTHYCVEETVLGLVQKRKRSVVQVVTRACADPSGNRWECFPLPANVSLV